MQMIGKSEHQPRLLKKKKKRSPKNTCHKLRMKDKGKVLKTGRKK